MWFKWYNPKASFVDLYLVIFVILEVYVFFFFFYVKKKRSIRFSSCFTWWLYSFSLKPEISNKRNLTIYISTNALSELLHTKGCSINGKNSNNYQPTALGISKATYKLVDRYGQWAIGMHGCPLIISSIIAC